MGLDHFKLNGEKCPFCLGNSLKQFTARAFDSKPKGQPFQIIECIDCCFAWQWPINRSENESTNYFEGEFKRKDTGSYFDTQRRIEVSNMQIEFVENLFSTKGKDLLDIGAGDGTFIKTAAGHGWNAVGIEPAKSDFSFNCSDKRGSAEMICGYLTDIPKDKKFDVITLWDVIEHVEEPIKLLKRALNLIKENAFMIIETGNYQSADRILGNKEWWCYQLDHRWYFSPPILKTILKEIGLKKVVVSSQTLRPWWNPKARYRRPSMLRVTKNVLKNPFRILSQIKIYFDLKRAGKDWPQWVANGIVAIGASPY